MAVLRILWAAAETAQWLGTQAALAEGPSSVPGTHFGQLTIACTASSRGPGALFLPTWALNSCAHSYTHIVQTLQREERREGEEEKIPQQEQFGEG